MSHPPRSLTGLVALAALAASTFAPTPSAEAQGFSSRERARLGRGQLVTRPEVQRHGGSTTFGGTSYQVIDHEADAVWEATHDIAAFRRMLPQVARAVVLSHTGSLMRVAFLHRSGPVEVRYTMELNYIEADRTLMFRLDETRPHDISAGWGFVRVRPYGENQTLISFGGMLGTDGGVLTSAMRPALQEWLLKVPLTMKWYLDRRRRQRLARR